MHHSLESSDHQYSSVETQYMELLVVLLELESETPNASEVLVQLGSQIPQGQAEQFGYCYLGCEVF